MQNFFASCPRGLETLLVEDLVAAGGQHIKAVAGGACSPATGRCAMP